LCSKREPGSSGNPSNANASLTSLLNPRTRRQETERLLRERIAYHEAKAREEEEARREAAG
jgi:hypothetical protein